MSDFASLAGAIAVVLTAIGGLAGLIKVYLSSRESKRIGPIDGFRGLTAALQADVDQLRQDRTEDRAEYDRRLAALTAEYDGRMSRLETRSTRDQMEIRELRIHIVAIRDIVAKQAPGVELPPMPKHFDL